MKVLICDDDRTITNLLKRTLEKYEIESDIVHNTGHMIMALEESKYDVLILDICFNNDTEAGRKALLYLKKLDIFNGKIIVFSRKKTDREIESCLELGAWDYLCKPLDEHILISKIYLSQGDIQSARDIFYFYELNRSSNDFIFTQTYQVIENISGKLKILSEYFINPGTFVRASKNLEGPTTFKVMQSDFQKESGLYEIELKTLA